MFTLDQVNEIHDRLGSSTGLAAYLGALRAIGVVKVVSFVTDGHTVHHGEDGHTIATPPAHEPFTIAATSDPDMFREALEIVDYEQMSRRLAVSGIEKWVFDTHALTISYYDVSDNVLLTEDLA